MKQYINRLFVVSLLPMLTCVLVVAQEMSFTVSGKLVDENSKPIYANVILTPSYNNWHAIDINTQELATDNDGNFTLNTRALKGSAWRLFTSVGERKGLILLSPPFVGVGKLDSRFLGRAVRLDHLPKINLGVLRPQYRYGHASVRILSTTDAVLTSAEWKGLWCRVRNEKGVVLAGRSIGPLIKPDEVDLKNSVLWLSLPEGNWTIDLLPYDDATAQIGKIPLASTGRLTIEYDQTQNISLRLRR